MNKLERRAFARRFSPEDWNRLCTDRVFLDALHNGTLDDAELRAQILLAEWLGLSVAPANAGAQSTKPQKD